MYVRIFNFLRARPGHWLVYLLFGLSAFPASAAVTLSQFPPNPGVLPGGGWQFTSGTTFADPPSPRAWVNGVYGGVPSATAVDSVALSGRAGALAVEARTVVSAAEVAMTLGRVAGGVGTALAVGSLAYDLLQSVGVRRGVNGAEYDAGSDPGMRDVYSVSGKTGASKFAACQAYAASVYIGQYQYFQDGYPVNALYRPVGYVGTQGQTEVCIVDGFNHLNQLTQPGFRVENFSITQEPTGCTEAATGASIGPRVDGKCPTGRYDSVPQSVIIPKIQVVVANDVQAAAKAAIAAGADIQSSGFAVTGPASQIGSPISSTTTAPDGTVTTTTTTPTYNYTYDGDKVTYTTTNETKVCTGANSCTTTITTTAPTTKQDPADPCTADPTRAGCTDLGDPNLKDKVPEDSWTFPGIIAKSMPSNKSCPSPITVNIPHGPAVVFSFDPLCDICLNYISKIVSVMSILTAVSVFVRSFKV